MRKWLVWILVIMLVLSLTVAGCTPAGNGEESGADPVDMPPEEDDVPPYKVGILTPSRITDEGWSQSGYEGIPLIQGKYNIEFSLIERPAQSDIPEHLRNMAVAEYDIIIAHGFNFYDALMEIAPEFPDVIFVSGGSQASIEPNTASYDIDSLDMGFLAGVVAGLVTETDRIGHIAGMEFPQLVDSLNAFEAGAKYVNPNVTMVDAWIGDWEDAAKGRELAVAMAESGVDVIFENAGAAGHGVIEGAQASGIYAIGVNRDKNYVAEDTVITSVIADYGGAVLEMFEKFVNDEFEPKFYYFSASDGMVYYAPFHQFEEKLGPEIMAQIRQIEADVISGDLVVTDYVESVFHTY